MYHVKFATIHWNLQVLSCIVYTNNLTIIYAAHYSQLYFVKFLPFSNMHWSMVEYFCFMCGCGVIKPAEVCFLR